MHFVILDTFHPSIATLLEQAGHQLSDVSNSSDVEAITAMESCDGILIRSRFPIRKQLIDQCKKLKIIGRVGAGLEHIDVAYAESKGIQVLSSPEGNRQAVAEHALAMLLSLFNHLSRSDREVRSGIWLRKKNEGAELQGKTVAIIGYGNTGSAFAKVLSGFGVNILAFDKYKSGFEHESSMEAIWQEADVVSIHLPLTEETKFLVSKNWLEKFAKPIYLVNTSRGTIVDTSDLLNAINSNRVLGACLDVLEFETENLKMPDFEALPDVAKRLFLSDRVLLSPHTAGLTVESYEKLSRVLGEKILNHINGQ